MKMIVRSSNTFSENSLLFALFGYVLCLISAQGDDERLGLHLGSFNTYSHQVSGDVYAVDQYTLLIKGFQYDGLGKDTFFWAGSTVRPSNVGFIVPDEYGRTNKLQRYTGKDLTIRLPDNKKITTIKWLSVWDLREINNYGDIYVSEGFEPPSPQHLGELSKLSTGVKSRPVLILDSKTLLIQELVFDGRKSEFYFWAGVGSIPDANGQKVPDERGYLNALGHYNGEDLVLELPGKTTFFDINWFCIWNVLEGRNYGSVLIPGGLNIPPALVDAKDVESTLPNCEQLHKTLQLSWEVFGPQITFQLAGQINEDDYMAIGISGSKNSSQMINADAAVTYMIGHSGFAVDYNITAKYPCSNALGPYRGVCPDPKLGGVENYQFQTANRVDGITTITFRRQLDNAGDRGDEIVEKESTTYLVWAIGKFNSDKEPGFHHTYPKGDTKVVFGRKPYKRNCYHFTTRSMPKKTEPWKQFAVQDPNIDKLTFHLGPSGAKKGYSSISGTASPSVVWYVNGAMAPNVYVKRGKKYLLRVEGGNNAHNTGFYHPLYLTDDAMGGYGKLTQDQRDKVKIYSGIKFDSKGRPQPISAGRLCIWEHVNNTDRRKDDDFSSFPKFRDSLKMRCEKGEPSLVEWTPDEATPDLLYYQSFTEKNMGWKIYVMDELYSNYGSKLSPRNVHIAILLLTIYWFFKTNDL